MRIYILSSFSTVFNVLKAWIVNIFEFGKDSYLCSTEFCFVESLMMIGDSKRKCKKEFS